MQEPAQQAKTIAIISYLTIIGWIIAMVMYNNEQNKSPLAILHLRQSLGLYITGFAIFMLQGVAVIIPILSGLLAVLLGLAGIGVFILWLLGLINAANGEEKAVPLVGEFYQDILSGLK
jgi:uncharacterized membrane protein